MFEQRFLPKAEAPGAEHAVDTELGNKIASIAQRRDRPILELRQVLDKLQVVWAQRDKLEKRYVVYLIAAFLYFISPVDAIPDPIPVVGYADDLAVAIFVLELIRSVLKTSESADPETLRRRTEHFAASTPVRKSPDEVTETHGRRSFVERGREWFENWVLDTVVRKGLDEATEAHVRRSVAAVAIGLWGATTAGAVSLGVASVLHATPASGIAYIVIVSILVCGWNAAIAVQWVQRFQRLDGGLQHRIFQAAASRLGLRELVAVGIPAFLLIAIAVVRFLTLPQR